MAKELMQIDVKNVPNGFALKVFKKEYLYWDEEELFKGLLYHAGMAIMKEADKAFIKQVVADLFANKEDARLLLMKRNQEQQIEIEKLSAKITKLEKENLTQKRKLEKLSKKSSNPFDIDEYE